MRRVIFALVILLAVGTVLGFWADWVRAATTGCEVGTDFYCSGDPDCTPDGSCSAQHCCDYPPDPPSGGCTADYQCGSGNCCVNGACKSCGGGASQCNADYIRNCAGTRTEQITGSQCVRIRSACKDGNTIAVGSAQSVGGCCEEWEVDGNLECRSLTVYEYTCCPVGTEASCYLGDPTYSYAYLNRTEEMGAPALSSFNALCSPGTPISMELYTTYKCDRTGAPKWDGNKTCYTYRATCRYPGVTLCDCVPACTATAPTGVSVTPGASNGAVTVSWTPGSGGSKQQLFVDQSQTEVNAGCPTANACEVKATNILNSTTSYPVTGLLPSTTYYFRVVTYKNASCTPSATQTYTTPAVTLSGRVYLDTDNNCDTTTPWSLGGLTVSVRGTGYTGSDFA